MQKNIIDNTAMFVCPKGIGVSFLPISNQMIAKSQGKNFLNENTKCIAKNVGQCTLQPNPSGTGFLPCTQRILPITRWEGIENTISISGAKALTSDASTMCPLGVKISLMNNCNTLFRVGGKFSISEISVSSTQKKSDGNLEKVSNDKKETDGNFGKEKEHTNDKYVLCLYEQCEDRDNCLYYCAKPELDNNASEMKKKFERDRFQEDTAYKTLHNRLRTEYPEYGWGYEGHHIISGYQVFMARDSNGQLKYGHLLKLASMCGYDINNAQNCVLLPSIERKEGPWGCLDVYMKKAKAFDVMDIMKRQWHLGGHAYTIPKDSLKYYKPTDEQLVNYGINEYFPDYATAVQVKLTRLNDIYLRKLCWKKRDSKEFRDKFIERMNKISIEIEQSLLSFEKRPKSSFPYFVSKQSVDYAYDVPKTGKIIIIYSQEKGLYASKFRISRKRKDNYQIIVTQNQEIPYIKVTKDTMLEFVKYCENIMHFLIDSRIEKELPWRCENEFICRKEINEKNINEYVLKHSTELFAFIDSNELENQGQLAQIRKRWREAKENVCFYNESNGEN